MDLKIKDVADLLGVSVATIRRWLEKRKIPAYRINHQYRFNRGEIEDWVMSCRTGPSQKDLSEKVSLTGEKVHKAVGQVGAHRFSLYRAIHKGIVLHDLEGKTKEEVICNAMEKIAENLNLDAQVLLHLLLDRERLMPTGLNHGIAVPHTRDFLLEEAFDVISIVYPKRPVEYGALDGKPVHTLFFLFACEDKRHLHLLAKLAHWVNRESNRHLLLEKPGKEELLEKVKAWESEISKDG